MQFRFARSARRHLIGRAHALATLASAAVPTVREGEHDGVTRVYFDWVGVDDRGVELEITGRLSREDPDLVIILHVMPTALKEG